MTEKEWLTCADAWKMVWVALALPRANDRTCRLFVAALWRWKFGSRTDQPDAWRVAAMERWADEGAPPKGIRTSQREETIFFNVDAQQALRNTVNAPYSWVDGAQEALVLQSALFRDIFGNPFRVVTFAPEWRTDTVVSLARGMYESRDFSAMPILADALQDAGCDSDDVLSHCRKEGATHVRGCWVVDLVLGKS